MFNGKDARLPQDATCRFCAREDIHQGHIEVVILRGIRRRDSCASLGGHAAHTSTRLIASSGERLAL
jgi:hypothetical protein